MSQPVKLACTVMASLAIACATYGVVNISPAGAGVSTSDMAQTQAQMTFPSTRSQHLDDATVTQEITTRQALQVDAHLFKVQYKDMLRRKAAAKARREAAREAARRAARAAARQQQQQQQQASAPAPPTPSGGGSYGAPPGSFQACVIAHESGGNPTAVNPASGAGGLYQFLPSTWAGLGLGYPGGAQTAPASVQTEGFFKLYAEAGTAPWAGDGC